jgi:hypothetical protein
MYVPNLENFENNSWFEIVSKEHYCESDINIIALLL